MTLALQPPLKPQLALSRKELPEGESYRYEIKLDGFRCLAFVDGEEIYLQSRNGKPLGRYFPELVLPYGSYVLDGEIVLRGADGREDFDALGQRIHPAASRIERLSAETPAVYVAFDMLARGSQSLLELAFDDRRSALEELLAGDEFAGARVELMPTVSSATEASVWLQEAEGAIAKERGAPYRPGERKGMAKVKRVRTIDAVLVGWRPGKEAGTVGALILGLYDGDQLRVVGHCSGSRRPRSAGWSASSNPSSRASAARRTPAAGAPARISSGSDCIPSWSSRSTSTMSPRGGSATAPSCAAGARIATPANAPTSSCAPERSSSINPVSADTATVAEEEYLQILFWLQEARLPMTGANVARAMQLSAPTVHEMIGRLERDGYVTRGADRAIAFTESGAEHAEGIVRRHRLIERFLTDVLGIPWDEVHEEAERLEHAMSPVLEERMRAAIGDAKTCPHGHPITAGARLAGVPLADVEVGATVKVLRFENEAEDLLHYLKASGIEPGMEGTLRESDDAKVVIETGAGGRSALTRSVAETVSVIADPSPPERTALPEQLVLGQRYGR